jgi:hypothetical protein
MCGDRVDEGKLVDLETPEWLDQKMLASHSNNILNVGNDGIGSNAVQGLLNLCLYPLDVQP